MAFNDPILPFRTFTCFWILMIDVDRCAERNTHADIRKKFTLSISSFSFLFSILLLLFCFNALEIVIFLFIFMLMNFVLFELKPLSYVCMIILNKSYSNTCQYCGYTRNRSTPP